MIFKSQRGFSMAGVGYTFYPVREGYFVSYIISLSCVLYHKYIEWIFLGILERLSLISNYLCVYTARHIFQRFIKSQWGFSNTDAGTGYTFYPLSSLMFHEVFVQN